jgi:hypothetical protein
VRPEILVSAVQSRPRRYLPTVRPVIWTPAMRLGWIRVAATTIIAPSVEKGWGGYLTRVVTKPPAV